MVISNFSWQESLYVPVLIAFSRKQSLKHSLCANTPVGVQSQGSKSEWREVIQKREKYIQDVHHQASYSFWESITGALVLQNITQGSLRTTAQTSLSGGIKAGYLPIPSYLLPLTGQSSPHGDLLSHPTASCYQPFGKPDTGPAVRCICGWSSGRGQRSREFSWVGRGHQSHWGTTAVRMMEAVSKPAHPP